jgi:hypothetical protein
MNKIDKYLGEALKIKGGSTKNFGAIKDFVWKVREKIVGPIDDYASRQIKDILKKLDTIEGKPEFGKEYPIGKLRGTLKQFEKKAKELSDIFEDVENAFDEVTRLEVKKNKSVYRLKGVK